MKVKGGVGPQFVSDPLRSDLYGACVPPRVYVGWTSAEARRLAAYEPGAGVWDLLLVHDVGSELKPTWCSGVIGMLSSCCCMSSQSIRICSPCAMSVGAQIGLLSLAVDGGDDSKLVAPAVFLAVESCSLLLSVALALCWRFSAMNCSSFSICSSPCSHFLG